MYYIIHGTELGAKEIKHAIGVLREGHVEELKIKNDSVSTFDAPATANLLILA